ncbi:MAG: HlyD family efflux transporter periplasmic adaptor subunit [Elusimicrobiota bacterium]|nr:HlyD family efflux transporter periplasmic adaptor subunit [Elusimicrobiota bacterium]
MKKRIIIIAAAVIATGVILMRITGVKTGQETTEPSGLSRVKAAAVQSATVEEEYKYVSTLKGVTEAMVYPRVPGIVKEKIKEPGDPIKKDGTILTVDRDEAALEYSLSPVESPVEGRVLRILADVGNRVTPQMPVAVVGDISTVRAAAGIPSEDRDRIKKGQPARIEAPGGAVIRGKVNRVDETVDERTGKYTAEITAVNSAGLRSGTVCDVYIRINRVETDTAVPPAAVTERSGNTGVFKVTGDDIAEWVEVEVLAGGRELTAVRGRLSTADTIVVEGAYGLIPGRKVKIAK